MFLHDHRSYEKIKNLRSQISDLMTFQHLVDALLACQLTAAAWHACRPSRHHPQLFQVGVSQPSLATLLQRCLVKRQQLVLQSQPGALLGVTRPRIISAS